MFNLPRKYVDLLPLSDLRTSHTARLRSALCTVEMRSELLTYHKFSHTSIGPFFYVS